MCKCMFELTNLLDVFAYVDFLKNFIPVGNVVEKQVLVGPGNLRLVVYHVLQH